MRREDEMKGKEKIKAVGKSIVRIRRKCDHVTKNDKKGGK